MLSPKPIERFFESPSVFFNSLKVFMSITGALSIKISTSDTPGQFFVKVSKSAVRFFLEDTERPFIFWSLSELSFVA